MAKTSETENQPIETAVIEQPEDMTALQPEITQEPSIEVRLLVDYGYTKAGHIAELPESIAKQMIAENQADDSAESLAYARSLT